MDSEQGWITVHEASELSGYGEQYLRRLIRNHKLKSKKLSFLWLVEKSSLLEYSKEAKKAPDKRRGPKIS
jgi:excisionase family DNA binding protein